MSDLDHDLRALGEELTREVDASALLDAVDVRARHRRRLSPWKAGARALVVGVVAVLVLVPVYRVGRAIWSTSHDHGGATQPSVTPTSPSPAPFIPSGDFVFIGAVDGRGGLYTMAATGKPERVASDVGGGGVVVSWSPSRDRVLVDAPVPGSESSTQLLIVDVATGASTQLTKFRAPAGGAWAPDRDVIAFLTAFGDVYTIHADGTGLKLVDRTSQVCNDDSVSWAPDGSQLAFSRDCEGPGQPGLYIASLDGSNTRRIYADPNMLDVAWSPDGSTLAFTERASPGEPDLYLTNTEGADPTPLVTEDPTPLATEVESPAWSPNGEFLAVVQDGEIRILDPATGNVVAQLELPPRVSATLVDWS